MNPSTIALFQPDIFSNPTPLFVPVAEPAKPLLMDILNTHYAHSVRGVRAIDQSGGNEINSKNFRIDAASGRWLLKKLPSSASHTMLSTQLSLLAWCLDRKIPVPRLMASDAGKPFIRISDQDWCLFEFIQGSFYSGTEPEFLSTAAMIGVLQQALSELPLARFPAAKWSYFADDEADILRNVQRQRSSWAEMFTPSTAAYLDQSWGRIEATAYYLNSHRGVAGRAEEETAHGDLHPHNILVHGGRLTAFLDFESFSRLPAGVSAAFAIYKLMKQYVIAQGFAGEDGRISKATRIFIEQICQGHTKTNERIGHLKYFALLEVFRRMLVVFRLNVTSRNSDWNHVLPMHLSGLSEIDILFNGIDSA